VKFNFLCDFLPTVVWLIHSLKGNYIISSFNIYVILFLAFCQAFPLNEHGMVWYGMVWYYGTLLLHCILYRFNVKFVQKYAGYVFFLYDVDVLALMRYVSISLLFVICFITLHSRGLRIALCIHPCHVHFIAVAIH